MHKHIITLLCLKEIKIIYRFKYIIALIISFTNENLGSYKKLYGKKYVKHIPKNYRNNLLINNEKKLIKFYAINNKSEKLIRFSSYNTGKIIAYNKINLDNYDINSEVASFYGIKKNINPGIVEYRNAIYSARYNIVDIYMQNDDNINIYVYYILYGKKKYDLIEKYINKIHIDHIENKYSRKNITKFLFYISSMCDYNEIITHNFMYLNIEYFIKYKPTIYLSGNIIGSNINLAYYIIKYYGIRNIDYKKVLGSIKFKYIMKLYNKKIITIEDLKYNEENETILFLIDNNIKPELNIFKVYTQEIIKKFIEKFGINNLSDYNLTQNIYDVLNIDPIRAIKIGWAYMRKISFYTQIKDKNIKIVLPEIQGSPNNKIIKSYLNQLKYANAEVNLKKAFKKIVKTENMRILREFNIKELIKDKKILKNLVKKNCNSVLLNIIHFELCDLKLLLKYACKYMNNIINVITKKETFCYKCGEHK